MSEENLNLKSQTDRVNNAISQDIGEPIEYIKELDEATEKIYADELDRYARLGNPAITDQTRYA